MTYLSDAEFNEEFKNKQVETNKQPVFAIMPKYQNPIHFPISKLGHFDKFDVQ